MKLIGRNNVFLKFQLIKKNIEDSIRFILQKHKIVYNFAIVINVRLH